MSSNWVLLDIIHIYISRVSVTRIEDYTRYCKMDGLLFTKHLVDMMSMHRSYLPADRQEKLSMQSNFSLYDK